MRVFIRFGEKEKHSLVMLANIDVLSCEVYGSVKEEGAGSFRERTPNNKWDSIWPMKGVTTMLNGVRDSAKGDGLDFFLVDLFVVFVQVSVDKLGSLEWIIKVFRFPDFGPV